jgi:hypothetical protein
MVDMNIQHFGPLERFAAKAIRLGAQHLEVEYKDGYEEVFAAAGALGFEIGRLRSSGKVAAALRQELERCTRRRLRIAVDGHTYELRGRSYDSFGEEAYQVQLRRI